MKRILLIGLLVLPVLYLVGLWLLWLLLFLKDGNLADFWQIIWIGSYF